MENDLNPMKIDVTGLEVVAMASSRSGEHQRNWTSLAIYYRPSASGRCFLAEIVGDTAVPGQVRRRRAVYVGSVDRALEFFDDGDLGDAIRLETSDWLDRNSDRIQPDIDQARAQEAGRRVLMVNGYKGSTLLQAVAWLYGDAQAGKAARLEEDFGVPRRTVAHALDQEQQGVGLTGWAKGFVASLRYFDREAFLAGKAGA